MSFWKTWPSKCEQRVRYVAVSSAKSPILLLIWPTLAEKKNWSENWRVPEETGLQLEFTL